MATSLTSTGVTFPDATVQTTAATSAGGTFEAVASGSLSDGSKVIVNADGTVSVVAITAQSLGTPVVFESARADYLVSCFDENANRLVIAYDDDGNSGYGTCAVGEISGSSISFGTPVVFESSNVQNTVAIAYDSTAMKVVVAFRNGGGTTTAKVGTVSGTTISFGSAGQIVAAGTSYLSMVHNPDVNRIVLAYNSGSGGSGIGQVRLGTVSGTSISFGGADNFEPSYNPTFISSVYDSSNQKVVISYNLYTGSSFSGNSIVATTTTSSVSFGSRVQFESGDAGYVSSAYHVANGKVVVAYNDNNNSGYGTVRVGTVSGTSISFGTAVVFESADTSWISAAYNSSDGKIAVSYGDGGNSSYGTLVLGSLSGTSISFETPIVFESATTIFTSCAYSTTDNKITVSYSDVGNSLYGTAVVFQPESTNLTATNYIGISDGAYTNGQTATVLIAGSVSEAQSGLTAGQVYYVQKDGTLSTTPDDPSVYAGTAIAATKLIVQG